LFQTVELGDVAGTIVQNDEDLEVAVEDPYLEEVEDSNDHLSGTDETLDIDQVAVPYLACMVSSDSSLQRFVF
jgi:hypothetical protein